MLYQKMIIYENLANVPEKIEGVSGIFIRSSKLYQLCISYLSIIFGGTV